VTIPGPRTVASPIWSEVQLDIDEAAEDLDHLITPEERLRIAMSWQ
jgi:hypothetical protein